MGLQLSMPRKVEVPRGLHYFPNFISKEEEINLLDDIGKIKWKDIQMHGLIAKRKVVHYGLDYSYTTRTLYPTEAAPAFLESLQLKAARLLGLKPSDLAEILISYYPIGAPIGWHRDAPMFDIVVGISLGGSCIMKFRKITKSGALKFDQKLARRSCFILEGEARWLWQHHIPPVKEERFSITFRTLKK